MFKVVKKRTLAGEIFIWAMYGVILWSTWEMMV